MVTASSILGAPTTAQLRCRTLSAAPCRHRGRDLPRTIRAAYDVDVEPAAPRAPNSAPRFGGSPPPPPPPPPPPQAARGLQPPSRRDLLFLGLGLGLGVAGTTAYDNRPLDPDEVDERLTSILDDILDDEALLNLLGEEVLLKRDMAQTSETVSALEGLKQVDDALAQLVEAAANQQGK